MKRTPLALLTVALTAALLLGMNAFAQPFSESPLLAARVAAGELPPLEERLPLEPLVLTPREIGTYGGTVQLASGSFGGSDFTGPGTTALIIDWDRGDLVGGIARDYVLSEDQTEITLFFREGMKWSNGEPVTVDDFIFRWSLGVNPDVPQGYRNEPIEDMIRVNDLEVRIVFIEPFARIVINLANEDGADWNRIAPFHHLKQWHLDHNPDAQALAEEEGFETWGEALANHLELDHSFPDAQNTETIQLRPYTLVQAGETTQLYERNPYYYVVDNAGQQLPYIDQVQLSLVDDEARLLRILNGDVDFASRFVALSFSDFSLLKGGEEAGDYRVVPVTGNVGSMHTFHVNQTHTPDPVLADVLRDLRFRQALSVSIDRDEMNDALWLGQGVPRAGTIASTARYYKPEWGEDHPFAIFDPDLANSLLDEIGLTERNADGIRLMSNGEPLQLANVFYGGQLPVEGWELVQEYWRDIGIQLDLREIDSELYWQVTFSPEYVLGARRLTNADEISADRGTLSGSFVTPLTGPSWAPLWANYLQAELDISQGRSTMADFPDGLPGEEPPAEVRAIWDALLVAHGSEYASEEWLAAQDTIYSLWAEQLYVIGTVGMVPNLVLASNRLGNIPGDNELPVDGSGWEAQFTQFVFIKEE
jgi:peptide/nickel transport system substrate-binding protein